MAYRRRRNQKESGIDLLLHAPWQVSAVLGVVVFIGLKWFLPALAGGSIILKSMAIAFSSVAWLISAGFFLISLVVYLKAAKTKNARPAAPQPKTIPWPPKSAVAKQSASPVRQEPKVGDSTELTYELKSSATKAPIKPTEWSIELIRDIEWKRFEDVCQQFYETKGIRSETTALGPDGGIDIRLYQDDSGAATSIVQCKAWGDRFVGVGPVRELLGVMTHEKIGKAFFMTSGSYSDDAKEVAKHNRITLIDGNMLLMMFKRLPPKEQQELLLFAVAGDYKTPTCPTCGTKMKHVRSTKGWSDFWGCSGYPRCQAKLGMRRSVAQALVT